MGDASELRTPGGASRRSEILAVALVALTAVAISAFVYEYSNTVAGNITGASLQSTEINAQIQASDMDHILLNELGSITSNLQLLAASAPVQAGNASQAIPLFQRAANSTAQLTYDYFWIDQHGDLVLSRNATGEVAAVAGANLTSRPYFVGAKEAGGIYYGALTQNLLNQSVVNIALPVYSTSDRAFEGVVGVSIDLATMGAFVQSQVSPLLRSNMGMLDSQGNILFSGNPQLEGKSIFGAEVQSLLPSSLKGPFDSFINSSLRGVSGVGELSYAGNSSTIAYQPILVAGPQDQGALHEFGVLYVSAPDVLAASQTAQINQFRALTGTLIFGIGVLSVGAGGIILGWNRRLDRAVKEKTSDLVSANEQLRQRTEELARANTEISSQADTQRDLFNITAHELRTPTQSILANAELMQEALKPVIETSGAVAAGETESQPRRMTEEELSDLAASTYRNAQRLQKLIQNILTVVRIESKNLNLQTESLDLDEKIGHVITDTRNVVETNGRRYSDYRIVYEPSGGPLRIRADRTKTYEILSNLIRNAVAHSMEGGRITVTSKPSDGFAVIGVRDEGAGIDPAVFPRLFTKFATKNGTGLGLYISKNYVEAQGGKIWAENNPDGGATFTFTLPLDAETPPLPSPGAADENPDDGTAL